MGDVKFDLRPFEWDNWKFYYPKMVVIETIGDGSCLIHAIAAACLWVYRRKKSPNGHPIDRCRFVRSIRSDLSKRLSEVIVPDTNREEYQQVTYYDLLGDGNIKELGKTNRNYSLIALQRLLQSTRSLDYTLLEFISDFFEKDLYFLSYETKDVLILEYTNDNILHKHRDSIVIMAYDNPEHFDLIGLHSKKMKTFFSHNHPFIKAIRARMLQQHKDVSRQHRETVANVS